ncbi:hypothetical protein [Streptomyces sp. NPDC057939]|uniref:hypothetical protein n=1 Tax=Streptomyces sp. NPDC057939 TaxID=3346284 RepID=UPI0036E4BBE7
MFTPAVRKVSPGEMACHAVSMLEYRPWLAAVPKSILELCGHLRAPFPNRLGPCADLAFPLLPPPRHRAERQLPVGHAVRRTGVVAPVSRRSTTAVIAQSTRDRELRC